MKGRSGAHGRKVAPQDHDPEKARAAEVFKRALQKIKSIGDYVEARRAWRRRFG